MWSLNKTNQMTYLISGYIREVGSLVLQSEQFAIPSLINQLTFEYYNSFDKWDENDTDEDIEIQKNCLKINRYSHGTACLSQVIDSNKYKWIFRVINPNDLRYFDLGIFQIKTLETESTAIKHNWRCAACGKQDNLWFNLSDGYVGCGRTQWDGSGGCSAARRHFDNTVGVLNGIVVKLGTITPEGVGDVWSYTLDDFVYDIDLAQELQAFGIDITQMVKFDKTIDEIEIESNRNFNISPGPEHEYGYMFDLITGQIWQPEHNRNNIESKTVSFSCKSNDILEMCLDVNVCELCYRLNGNDCGVKIKVEKGKYRAGVYLWNSKVFCDQKVMELLDSGYY